MSETLERFRRSLGSRIGAIEVAVRDSASGDAEALSNARRVAEALASSAAALNLEEISLAAGKVKECPDAALETNLRALMQILRREAAGVQPALPALLIIGGHPDFNAKLTAIIQDPARDVIHAGTAEEADRMLLDREVVLIILHFFLPDADGRTMYLRLCENPVTISIPVLILSQKLSETFKNDTLLQSADGYIENPDEEQVAVWVKSRLRRTRETVRSARRDLVTGLLNRAAFCESFQQAQEIGLATKEPLSVACLTLESTAETLSAMPQLTREELLQSVGLVLSSSVRTSDIVARWGTYEFAALFPGEDPAGAVRAVEKVLENFRQNTANKGEKTPGRPVLSAGVALVTQHGTMEESMSEAERNMLKAAANGGNRVFSDDSGEAAKQVNRVLLVLQDPVASRVVRQLFEKDGFDVTLMEKAGPDLSDILRSQKFHLILIDESIPGSTGFEVLQEARGLPRHSRTPIVMLTSRDAEDSTVRALKLGATDCVARPFSPFTFITRMRRLLSRSVPAPRASTAFCRVLVVDADPGTLVIAGTALHQSGGVEVYLARGMEDGLQRLEELAPEVLFLDFAVQKADRQSRGEALLKNVDFEKTTVILGIKEKTAEVEKLLTQGIKATVTKPYNPRTVGEDIQRILGRAANAGRAVASSDHLNREIQRILGARSPGRSPG